MGDKLRISLVQTSLTWEDPSANFNHLQELCTQVPSNSDLIVLPEMFSTGFTMKPELHSETVLGKGLKWMQDLAHRKNCVVTGSLAIEENSKYYNRLFWVSPDGSFSHYNKRHLFSLAEEEKHYTQGEERLLVELKGFKILPLICYDLRFPVWSRNNVGYDVAIYVANWPERRSFFWKQLLIARSIENQCFIVGVNRVGEDGNGVSHSGDSVCLGPLGNEIGAANPLATELLNVEITKEELTSVRNKFSFLDDQDKFEVIT